MRERYHRAAGAPSSKPLATHAYARSGTLMPSPGEPGREASVDPTTSHSHPHDDRGVTRRRHPDRSELWRAARLIIRCIEARFPLIGYVGECLRPCGAELRASSQRRLEVRVCDLTVNAEICLH